jgi:hypothetical protein
LKSKLEFYGKRVASFLLKGPESTLPSILLQLAVYTSPFPDNPEISADFIFPSGLLIYIF